MSDRPTRRIQLQRTKGWRKPDGVVVVSRPSKWGNPWRAYELEDATPENVVRWYRSALEAGTLVTRASRAAAARRVTVADIRRELRGKDLGCWCALDQPCHADVLLEIANG